ncbi:hypothetical protein KCP70_11720 [Salmonella enterica subsp. enterica]|nr:hypothetical protein KCP70_11720 [Salmonella enterica subsp. enterica]
MWIEEKIELLTFVLAWLLPEFWRHFQVRNIKLEERSQKRKRRKTGCKARQKGGGKRENFSVANFSYKTKHF